MTAAPRSRAAGFCLAVILLPASASAQDATALVVLSAPPLLLAPVMTGIVRYAWMRRTPGSRFSAGLGSALSVLEFVLWLLAAWFGALTYFQQSWIGGLILAASLAIIVAINRRFAPPHRSVLFSLALAGVFPLAWLLVQLAWYLAFLAV